MADYYPLIARAVAGLEKSTGEARRALYERARTALVTQLRGVTPTLSESDITRERLALEEAIRKVEAESARRSRTEAVRAGQQLGARPSETRLRDEGAGGLASPARSDRLSRTGTATGPASSTGETKRLDTARPEARPSSTAPTRTQPRMRLGGEQTSLGADGLKDFRNVVSDPESLGGAAAQASRSARDSRATAPTPTDLDAEDFDLAESDEDVLQSARDAAGPRLLEPAIDMGDARPAAPRARQQSAFANEQQQRPERRIGRLRSYRGFIRNIVIVALIATVGVALYSQRANIASLYQQLRGQPTQAARDAAPARPKIADRVGQPDQAQPGATGTQSAAAVAQRVVLYEEEPNDAQGKRYVGSAIWRTETVSPGPGLAPELAVRADVEIPERHFTMTFSIRRNTDQALPASHTMEILFNLPADFSGGGISNVPGILMKQSEQTRGVPLAGLAVKVTTGFFLIGLSAVQSDVERNVALLKERAWFDIPIVYTNNRRAILAIEKGTPGDRAFEDAFKAWEKK